ncbi:hypothetical protein PGUG_03017 [Meyerozyma guilliermondii ATCC 6260]|uniref:DNA-directed RNA polymerase III subunit RPC9 n=1 Tax=Meyerozyma guilliermondii (strain ATCC 6260 / CBS 566 / DSM 6381 / JCM 1539 / NBRC 10279 / NRRL Y-324) TaxID=294746 RepID=A5DIB6_PICGU|nr:uncharacterized protein PGUG_03017 [Meyerozyma guilliermondii ATCC 6260]EDK38919.1 hypothetical protein PGUG_03017 [Meyerozyma guilliermondii ATCC 6260]
MQIINERDKFLSNYEVLQHLKEIKEKNNWVFENDKNDKKGHRRRGTAAGLDLEVITKDILSYADADKKATITSSADFTALLQYLNQFDLVKVEKLQIVNSLPRTMVHLYALVEECDQRLSDEQSQGILDKIAELFPVEEDEEMEEAEE